jgi:hypothetical protein
MVEWRCKMVASWGCRVKRVGWSIGVLALTAWPVWAQDVVEESPFLIWGRAIDDPDLPNLSPVEIAELQEMSALYPDIQSCLNDPRFASSDSDQGDISNVSVRRDYRSRVCLSRIFTSLGDPASIERWMTGQGWLTWGSGEIDFPHYAGKRPIFGMMFQRQVNVDSAEGQENNGEQFARYVRVEIDAGGIILNINVQ